MTALISETVLYFHHRDAKKPMAGLVIDANEDGSVTVLVYLSRKPGQTFPALWLRETPTGKTGHYYIRRAPAKKAKAPKAKEELPK